jgi:hypothetical protein
MTNLSRQKNYIDLDLLTLNKNTLNQIISFTSQLNLEQLMKVSNLSNGMYGLYTNTNFDSKNIYDKTVDFEKALKLMSLAKVAKMKGRFFLLMNEWAEEYDQETTKKSNLNEFKTSLAQDLSEMLQSFDKEKFYKKQDVKEDTVNKIKRDTIEGRRFFSNYFKHINEKILLSYCITELLPSQVNPAFNIVAFNKLLEEAGPEFIYKIPAMHDPYLSHGAFQLTSQIITPLGAPSLNEFFPDSLKIPASMKYYDTPQKHNRAAIMALMYNAEILENILRRENQLAKFNNNFEKLSDEQQEIFIAGQASAAHHASTRAAKAVVAYQKAHEKKGLSNIISEIEYGEDLDRYYKQSVMNYLVLDAMEKMQDETSKKSQTERYSLKDTVRSLFN